MNTEDYVSYPVALSLKDAGFDEPCEHYYDNFCAIEDEYWYIESGGLHNWNTHGDVTSAPTFWHAQKWLREKKKIDVLVYNCACGYTWEVSKAINGTRLIEFDEKGDDESSGCWTSYEGSLSAGISASLELIKKGE